MELQGIRLTINAQAEKGEIVAEVLDDQGKLVPGYSREDCRAFSGDSLRHALSWKGGDFLGGLLGGTVRLRFHLRNARLYSYTIGG